MLMPVDEVDQLVERLRPVAQTALQDRHAVITGAGGFLGRWLVPVLAKLGAYVDAIESSDLGCQALDALKLDRVTTHSLDLLSPFVNGALTKLTPCTPGAYVIHMAGIASPQQYHARPLETLELSYTVSRHMLEMAVRARAKYLFFSSSEIYGDPEPDAIPTKEDYPGRVSCNGSRCSYDEGKRVGEALASVYGAIHPELHTNVVRPFNVYGPGMLPTDYRVLPNFAKAVLNGQPMQVYGSGEQTRTYCYVTDFVDGVVRLLVKGQKGLAYNIGCGWPEVSVRELTDQIRAATVQPGWRIADPMLLVPYPSVYPSDEPSRRRPDIARAREHLGYEPRVGLHEGLTRFLQWARQEKSYVERT